MPIALLTGFEPFNGESINPSYEVIKSLPKEMKDIIIITEQLPTVFNKAAQKLEHLIAKHKPDIIICLGQAGGRFEITPERVAINLQDASMSDNEGAIPQDKKIQQYGENAYFTKLPIKAIVKELHRNQIPASISNTAGTYVCNDLMYSMLYYLEQMPEERNIKAGFVHIPYLPEQVVTKRGMPSMSFELIQKAIEIMIVTAGLYDDDIIYDNASIT